MQTCFGEMTENLPSSWEEITPSAKEEFQTQFKELGNGVYGFIANKDVSDKTMVIDPVPTRLWGTYYGGIGQDNGLVVTDKALNVYIYSETASASNIATSGAFQTSLAGLRDGFIAKLDSAGRRIWGTYFGDSNHDKITALDIDENLNIYAAAEKILNRDQQIFLLNLNPNGTMMLIKPFGGEAFDIAYGIKVFENKVYLCGETFSKSSISTANAFQPVSKSPSGSATAFLAKFDNTGNLEWSTFFGGTDVSGFSKLCKPMPVASVYWVELTVSTACQ